MDEFDLNRLRVDKEIFESRKEKLRIKKYLDTCGQGVTYTLLQQQNCKIAKKGKMSTKSILSKIMQ